MDAEHQSSGKRGRRKKKQQDDLLKLRIESMEERIAEDENPRKLCTICKKDFPSGKALGGHMRVHAQDSSSHRHRFNGDGTGSAPVCDACGRSFHSWKSLYGHMRCHSHSRRRQHPGDDLLRAIPPWPVTGKRGREGGSLPAPEVMEAARNLMWLAGGPRLWAGGGYFCKGRFCCDEIGVRIESDSCFLLLDDGDDEDDDDDGGGDRKLPKIDVNVTFNGGKEEVKKKRGRKKKKPVVEVEITEDFKEPGTRPVDPELIPGRGGFRCVTCKKEFSTHQALGGHRSKHYKERIGADGGSCSCNPGSGAENGPPGPGCCSTLGGCLVPGVYQWRVPTSEAASAPVMSWEAGRIGLVVEGTTQLA